jgi:hypothetical protein
MANDALSATERGDLLDTVHGLAHKLHALLCAARGESFRSFNDEIPDNYMWA